MNEVASAPAARPPFRPRLGWRIQLGIFLAALLIGLGLVAVSHRSINRETSELEQQLASEKKREAEFGKAKNLYDTYRELMNRLEGQIRTVEAIRTQASGPAQFMNDLEKIARPVSGVRLTAATYHEGHVALSGRTSSEERAKGFMATLSKSGRFSDLESGADKGGNPQAHEEYAFTIHADYTPAATERPADQDEPPAGTPNSQKLRE